MRSSALALLACLLVACPGPAKVADPVEPEEALLVTSEGDAGALVVEYGQPSKVAASRLVSRLGPREGVKKVSNLDRFLAQPNRDSVSAFLLLDVPRAPQDVRGALAAAGASANTISGDIATVQFSMRSLGAILALPWVKSVEVGSSIKPR
jgi:hypothetical protein